MTINTPLTLAAMPSLHRSSRSFSHKPLNLLEEVYVGKFLHFLHVKCLDYLFIVIEYPIYDSLVRYLLADEGYIMSAMKLVNSFKVYRDHLPSMNTSAFMANDRIELKSSRKITLSG